jgi:hypothetical protein
VWTFYRNWSKYSPYCLLEVLWWLLLFGWFELPIGVTARRLPFFVPTKSDRRNKF